MFLIIKPEDRAHSNMVMARGRGRHWTGVRRKLYLASPWRSIASNLPHTLTLPQKRCIIDYGATVAHCPLTVNPLELLYHRVIFIQFIPPLTRSELCSLRTPGSTLQDSLTLYFSADRSSRVTGVPMGIWSANRLGELNKARYFAPVFYGRGQNLGYGVIGIRCSICGVLGLERRVCVMLELGVKGS